MNVSTNNFTQYADWTAEDWTAAERTSKDESQPVEMQVYALRALASRRQHRLTSAREVLQSIPCQYTDKYPAVTELRRSAVI